jgi:hypothetical protein
MEWKNKIIDTDNMSLMFEFLNGKEAKYVTDNLCKSIWRNGVLSDLDGLVTNVTTVVRYVIVGTDASMDELLEIVNFVAELSEEVNEDFSMGVSGPTGLNQGIPHGGPGKGVLPKPLYNPKAKAVPTEEKDDKDTEENLKKLRAAKKLLKNEGFAIVRENTSLIMGLIDQFENYLHDKCGFSWDEVDSLVDTNQEMIEEKLKLGMSFENIAASLDDSCLQF